MATELSPLNSAQSKDWTVVKVCEDNPELCYLKFPAIATAESENHWYDGRKEGEPLWPDRYTLAYFEKERDDIGKQNFDTHYQGDPRPDGVTFWGDDLFGEEVFVDVMPTNTIARVCNLDSAGDKTGKKRQTDYVCFCTVFWGEDGLLYVKADMRSQSPTQLIQIGLDIYNTYNLDYMTVEKNFGGDHILSALREEAARRNMNFFNGLIWNHIKKEIRVRNGLDAFLYRTDKFPLGRLRFFNDPDTRRLVEQLQYFPHYEHDDGPDSLEMAIRALIQEKGLKKNVSE